MRVLFLSEDSPTFVRSDVDILQSFAEVTTIASKQSPSFLSIGGILARQDLVYAWFGIGYATRAVIAGRVLAKPSIIVGGGWDVADMPEIEYGAARGTYGRTRASVTFGLADRVLAFSKWSAGQIHSVAPRAPVQVVYLGVDPELWRPSDSKQGIVLTTANLTMSNIRRKGLETFARASRLVPGARFIMAGYYEPQAARYLTAIGGENLEFTGRLDDGALRRLAGRSKVYVQVSHTEGFGLALAEAMSAGCTPVVTRAGALPEVVGDCGLYVPEGDPAATADAIREALVGTMGSEGRQRIADRFELDTRKRAIQRIVIELVES